MQLSPAGVGDDLYHSFTGATALILYILISEHNIIQYKEDRYAVSQVKKCKSLFMISKTVKYIIMDYMQFIS